VIGFLVDGHGHTCECGQTFTNPENLKHHIAIQNLGPFNEYETRKPQQSELVEVVDYYVQQFGMDYNEAVATVNGAFHTVIDGYQTFSPGFADKVLIEISENGPSQYNIYTWKNSSIQRQKRATELQKQDKKGEN